MPYYMKMGSVPQKRHVQFRKPDGTLYAEQVFGLRGFSGRQSILYHGHLPTQVSEVGEARPNKPEAIPYEPLRHRHMKTAQIPAHGDPITGRVTLMFNDDVQMGLCRPIDPMDYHYKNADADECLFVHHGRGVLESMFGSVSFRDRDYLVIPRGTIYRLNFAPGEAKIFFIVSPGTIEPPKRYRNEYGQLLEHAPYCERDLRAPEKLVTHDEAGRFEALIQTRGHLVSYFYDFHPLDVVGWDGFVYPYAFNIDDFEPITGRIHQPPPVHQTFEASNYVICSFCPRKLDYHPEAIPIPYNHSNLESDEMLYYCNSKFGSRKGIEEGSITLHPNGLPHGPQPGAVEASLGAQQTEELAVMVDTFRPLHLTRDALEIEDPNYAYSWKAR